MDAEDERHRIVVRHRRAVVLQVAGAIGSQRQAQGPGRAGLADGVVPALARQESAMRALVHDDGQRQLRARDDDGRQHVRDGMGPEERADEAGHHHRQRDRDEDEEKDQAAIVDPRTVDRHDQATASVDGSNARAVA